jgi:hypothetical protein
MGYTTDFSGVFKLDKPLTAEHAAYLKKFSDSRRMKRDSEKAAKLPDPEREAVGLPVSHEGAYFVGGYGYMGQDGDGSVLDHNAPPVGQPGLWCQWVPTEDGDGIEWDEGEKFCSYVEWLEYLIEHFLKPWGYVLNGEVSWRGEDFYDVGTITVEDNEVSTRAADF